MTDPEKLEFVLACKYVDEAVEDVKYGVIPVELMDKHNCDFATHGLTKKKKNLKNNKTAKHFFSFSFWAYIV